MGLVQTVDVDLVWETNIDGVSGILEDFEVTELTTNHVFGGGGSSATLKGTVPVGADLSPLKQVREPDTEVEVGINVDTEIGDIRFADRVYTGFLLEASRNSKRTVTFELLDARYLLNRLQVQLDTRAEGEKTSVIARQLLSEDPGGFDDERFIIDLGGFSGLAPDTSADDSGLIKPGESKPISAEINPSVVRKLYGADRTVSMYVVLQDLARIEDAFLWIDRFNRIRLERIPDFTYWDGLGHVISFTESSSDQQQTETIVDSPYDSTGVGYFSTIGSQNQRATAKLADDGNKQPRKLDEKNVVDAQALQKTGDNQLVKSIFRNSSGTIKVAGNPIFHPNDQLTLDNIPDYIPVDETDFTIKEVKHTLNGSEGFTTTLKLGQDLETLYDRLSGQSTHALRKRQKVRKRKKNNLNAVEQVQTTVGAGYYLVKGIFESLIPGGDD